METVRGEAGQIPIPTRCLYGECKIINTYMYLWVGVASKFFCFSCLVLFASVSVHCSACIPYVCSFVCLLV